MPARLRPTPMTISLTKSVRACGNATPFSTALGCVCSRASTSLKKASGLAIFLPLVSDASTSTISRIAFAGFRERNRRITCCSISRSASAIGMGAERFIGLCRKRSYPVKEQIMATQDTAVAPKEERTVSLQRSLYDPGYVNAMSHFYRGELGRIMVWRQRLATTPHWAIPSSTATTPIPFSTPQVTRPHHDRVLPPRGAAHHFLFQSRHRLGDALDRSAALPLLRRVPRPRPDARGAFSRPDGHGKSGAAPGRVEKTGLRRFDSTEFQNHQVRGNRAPIETQLRFHLHSDHGRVDNE